MESSDKSSDNGETPETSTFARRIRLSEKLQSAMDWGMRAGFWIEVPLMTAFLFKPFKPMTDAAWAKVSEVSVKIILPTTLTGVAYGFFRPAREEKKSEAAAQAGHAPVPAPLRIPTLAKSTIEKSWAAAELARDGRSDEQMPTR